MKVTITKSLDFFQSINAPKLSCVKYIRSEFKFPYGLQFNRTYYIHRNGQLTAFRILAYAYKDMCKNGSGFYGLTYLVQFPNQAPEWINKFLEPNTQIFASIDDFIQHQGGVDRSQELHWTCARPMYVEYSYAAVIGLKGKLWKWDYQYNQPNCNYDFYFKYFVVCEEGTFIGISDDDYYFSAEECAMSKLNGMQIVDFADEPVKITINVLPNTPKMHTLRFVED